MSETHSVKRHLDVEADAYDAQIRRFIPHYDDMLANGVELLGSRRRGLARAQDSPGPRLHMIHGIAHAGDYPSRDDR